MALYDSTRYTVPLYKGATTSWLPGGDRDPNRPSWFPTGDNTPTQFSNNVYPSAPSPSRYTPGYSVGGGQLSNDPGQNFAAGKFLLSDYWKKAADTAGTDISGLRQSRLSFSDMMKSAGEGLKTANTQANRYMDTWMNPDKISGRYDTANVDWQNAMTPLIAQQRTGLKDYVGNTRSLLSEGDQNYLDLAAANEAAKRDAVAMVGAQGNLMSLQVGGAGGLSTGSAASAYAGREATRQGILANERLAAAKQNWIAGTKLPTEGNILQATTGQSRYEGDIATKYWGTKNAQTDALASHAARAAQMAPDQARQYLLSLNIAPQQMQQLMAAEMDLRNQQYQMAQRGEETYVYPKQMPFLNASRTQSYLYPNDTLNRYG